MSVSSSEPRPARNGTAGQLDGGISAPSSMPRARSRMPARLVLGVLSALLLYGTASHIWPAIRAARHDGTRGYWIATTTKCARSACTWTGKFVSSTGHLVLTSAQYDGRLPASMHAGASVAALYPGGSGVVFPAAGSDLWISLLVALVLSVVGLYWSSHRLVRNYLTQHRSAAAGTG